MQYLKKSKDGVSLDFSLLNQLASINLERAKWEV
jgi:hypothetical protein